MSEQRPTAVSLSREDSEYVAGEVAAGHFQSAGEVVQAALRVFQFWTQRKFVGNPALHKQILEGIESARNGSLISMEALFAELDQMDDEERSKHRARKAS